MASNVVDLKWLVKHKFSAHQCDDRSGWSVDWFERQYKGYGICLTFHSLTSFHADDDHWNIEITGAGISLDGMNLKSREFKDGVMTAYAIIDILKQHNVT